MIECNRIDLEGINISYGRWVLKANFSDLSYFRGSPLNTILESWRSSRNPNSTIIGSCATYGRDVIFFHKRFYDLNLRVYFNFSLYNGRSGTIILNTNGIGIISGYTYISSQGTCQGQPCSILGMEYTVRKPCYCILVNIEKRVFYRNNGISITKRSSIFLLISSSG